MQAWTVTIQQGHKPPRCAYFRRWQTARLWRPKTKPLCIHCWHAPDSWGCGTARRGFIHGCSVPRCALQLTNVGSLLQYPAAWAVVSLRLWPLREEHLIPPTAHLKETIGSHCMSLPLGQLLTPPWGQPPVQRSRLPSALQR